MSLVVIFLFGVYIYIRVTFKFYQSYKKQISHMVPTLGQMRNYQ